MDTATQRIRDNDARKTCELIGNQLYHYTSIGVLKGMLLSTKKEFWLGSARQMNDSRELIEYIYQLRDYLLEQTKESPDKHDKCKQLFEDVEETLQNKYPYIMCFSKNKDDAAQWERYGDNGRGVCICFNSFNLVRLFSNLSVVPTICNVFYERDISKHQHIGIITNYLNGKKISEKSLIDSIIATAAAHKNYHFETEREVRVSIPFIFDRYTPDFECISGIIKEYIKIDLEAPCQELEINVEDLIDEILVGPKSSQDISILIRALKANGHEHLAQRVIRSDCPLR